MIFDRSLSEKNAQKDDIVSMLGQRQKIQESEGCDIILLNVFIAVEN